MNSEQRDRIAGLGGDASDAPKVSSPNNTGAARRQRVPFIPRLKAFILGFILGGLVLLLAVRLSTSKELMNFLFPGFGFLGEQTNEIVVTDTFLESRLEAASELTTAKFIYSGVLDYDSGGVVLINRSRFSMFYSAVVRAGIDVEDIGIEVDDKTVTLTIPSATIMDVHIDPTSLRFFDEKSGIVSSNSHNETAEALQLVEEDIRKVDMTQQISFANEQLDDIMRGLFEGVIGDRELVLSHDGPEETTAENATIDTKGDMVD